MTVTTGTPEAVPTSQSELSDSERHILSLATADEWRTGQKAELSTLRDNGDVFDAGYITTFNDGIDDNLDAYLQAKGVEPTSPHYNEMRQALRDASIDRVNDEEWYTRPSSRGESVEPEADISGRDMFARRANEYLAAHAAAAESQEDVAARAEVLAESKRELDEARDRFSTLAAKRQSSAVRGESEEYKEAQAAYRTKLREYGKLSLDATIEDESVSPVDKNTAVIDYILQQETQLRDETIQKRSSTPKSKFIRFMNQGNLKVRIAKGVVLGLVAGATGAFIAGVTGGAAVAGIAAAASRFVRGYVMHADKREMEALDRTETTRAILENHSERSGDADADLFDAADDHLSDRFEKDTKIQQNERRKALAWGIGSVAVGGALGILFEQGIDAATHATGGGIQDHGAGGSDGAGHGPETTPPATTPPSDRGLLPNMPGAGEAAHHLLDRNASFTITPGEGLYQTFQDMGIPSADWHDVMVDAGPKLHELGETYWDPAHAEWRISHPGQWSDAAMKIMTDTASQHGYSLAA